MLDSKMVLRGQILANIDTARARLHLILGEASGAVIATHRDSVARSLDAAQQVLADWKFEYERLMETYKT